MHACTSQAPNNLTIHSSRYSSSQFTTMPFPVKWVYM
jgi:hypothetical protein